MKLTLSASVEELRKAFFALRIPRDVADILEIDLGRLTYHLYRVPPDKRYTTFDIPKKIGGCRTISTPVTALKIIQRKLNEVLQVVYPRKACVHGFLRERSILTNAEEHSKRRYVLNLDLKDFFPSINFGRIRGMFMAVPYKLNSVVATVLAQICCYNNELPQGAPTSPIVSNMICAKMDSQLQHLAKRYQCFFTRYADDISFSTSLRDFPQDLATINPSGQVEVGPTLRQIIVDNGFDINLNKVRLQCRNKRQEVTGLTINKFPNVRRRYVRQIRAMLHAWRKFGLEAAQEEFLKNHDRKHRNPSKTAPSFAQVVKGKIEFIGMVRGKNNDIYCDFLEELKKLAPELVKINIGTRREPPGTKPFIITEGKTDWKHLKAALEKLQKKSLHLNLELDFNEYDANMGDDKLLKECKVSSQSPHDRPIIYVFDRDNEEILEDVTDQGKMFKYWSNRVFSFAIPVPDHRKETPNISLEFYYKDSEIKRQDEHGRRLFISSEFNSKSGRHNNLDFNCTDLEKIKRDMVIIDSRVFDGNSNSVALSKNSFAEYVLSQARNFDNLDVSEFSKIFDIVSIIIEENHKIDK